jgi:hypothetical protein
MLLEQESRQISAGFTTLKRAAGEAIVDHGNLDAQADAVGATVCGVAMDWR